MVFSGLSNYLHLPVAIVFGKMCFMIEEKQYVIIQRERRRGHEGDIRLAFQALHINDKAIDDCLYERIAQLDARSETMSDELSAIMYEQRFFQHAKDTESPHLLSPEHRHDVRLATLLTDIGKTGPSDSTHDQREVITSIFAIDGNIDGTKVTIEQYISKNFPEADHQHMRASLDVMGIDRGVTMREFWNMHLDWGYEILQNSTTSPDVILIAGSHHLLEGNIPDDIINFETGKFQVLGVDREIDTRDVLVALFDKYDAQRRRAGVNHETAIEYLYGRVVENETLDRLPDFVRDLFMSAIVDVDIALAEEVIDKGSRS